MATAKKSIPKSISFVGRNRANEKSALKAAFQPNKPTKLSSVSL